MADSSEAYVAHQIAGRARIRVPDRRNDRPYFERLAKRIAELADIVDVAINPATTSVMVVAADVPAVINQLEAEGYFTLVASPSSQENVNTRPLLEQTRQALDAVDRHVNRVTEGKANLRSLAIMTLLGAGLIQLVRGEVFAPAATLFWYGGRLLSRRFDESPNVGPGSEGTVGQS